MSIQKTNVNETSASSNLQEFKQTVVNEGKRDKTYMHNLGGETAIQEDSTIFQAVQYL